MIENNKYMESPKKGSSEVPTLIRYISSNEVVGFDILEENKSFMNDQNQPISHDPLDLKTEKTEKSTSDYPNNETELNGHQRTHSVSISLPASPLEVHMQTNNNDNKRVNFSGETIFYGGSGTDSSNKSQNTITELPKSVKFHSHPMPKGSLYHQADDLPPVASTGRKMDKRFDSFKTFSGRLERQITNLRGSGRTPQTVGTNDVVMQVEKNLPVDRFFDALQGPELDTLRASEEILLPEDQQWPFLLRFPISSFGICLGVSSQAIMWKALATSASTKFLHLSLRINFSLWCISVFLIALVFSIYLLKLVLYFEAVRREYYHPIRVNFFFAPWIALLFLALGVPPSVAENLPPALWYVLMTPIFCIEIKIYGQWMSGGQRRLSKVANPSNHLSIVGNFVGALLGASMGLKEGPLFFFAVGLAHYIVLFVTLYQRLPTNETLPKELHPVFFLFVAAPSVASMAWDKIQGSFDYGSRIAYFIALFLYFSLAVRINFFRGFKFSLAWWAYTFPMTGAAIATVKYSTVVTNVFTRSLAVVLSVVATLTVMALLVTTILHAFVFRKLFPNDIAIAISDRKPKHHKHWFHLRHGSSEDIDKYLKFADTETNTNDIEASLKPTSDDNTQV